jgi:hypothetical protein
MTAAKTVGTIKPTQPQRRLFWVLHLKHVPCPDSLKNEDDRKEYKRVTLLEGWVPALGYAPLTSRSQIDKALMSKLLDVLTAMDAGTCEWDGEGFVDVDGNPWEGDR